MKKRNIAKVSFNQKGFGLVQVLVTAAITVIIALSIASVQMHQTKLNVVLASQSANMALGAAVRTQLARRQSCLPSLVIRPTAFTKAGSEIGVLIGSDAATQTVRAGAVLPAWKLKVDSIRAVELSPYGTTNLGYTVWIGDIVIRAMTSELDPNTRLSLKEYTVARITFEVQGGTVMACYTGDAYSDTRQQLEQVCNMTTSPDGSPGKWVNGKCVVMDQEPQTTCAAQGGDWNGSLCTPHPSKTCVAMGGKWENASCSFRKGSVGSGCTCVPYNNNTNCSGAQGGSWTCWGGADPGGVCPSGYGRQDTGFVSGGPTGFVCVGQ
jgi:Tfp pilus assembly protein PilV